MYKHIGTQCHAHTPIYLTQYIYVYMHAISNVSFPSIFCHFKSQKPIAMANGGVRLDRILVSPTQGASRLPNGSVHPKKSHPAKSPKWPGEDTQTSQFWWRNLKTLTKTETWLAAKKNNLWMKMYVNSYWRIRWFSSLQCWFTEGQMSWNERISKYDTVSK